MKRSIVLWGPVVVYMAILFGLSSQSSLPQPPGTLSDKHLHAIAYGGLSALACRALAAGALDAVTPARAVGAVGVAVLYGATDEFHQAFVPGRSSDVLDLVADGVGAALAAGGLWAWGIIARSMRERRRVEPPA